MRNFNPEDLKKLYIPPETSHKGKNGKLLIIGGSHLFHAASLWALEIASKIVDMVFYSSVPENNKIVLEVKSEFRNGIVVSREHIADYIEESDVILIGPGMVRAEQIQKSKLKIQKLSELEAIKDEGAQTYLLTEYLLRTYPYKKWVIDAGALQMLQPKWLLPLKGNAILTPHVKEFERLFLISPTPDEISHQAAVFNSVLLVKSHADIVCSSKECVVISGGNAGMTKGGTGDVLAGLTAALYCKNDAFLAAKAASYFNKKAGEKLFERVGYYFNASDLVKEIPKVMKEILIRPEN